ncbi:MAG: TetR/AcrR family transcriptional regulator [Acidimicrobiales bacterium]
MPRRAPALDISAIVAGLGGLGVDEQGEVGNALLDATADLVAAYGVRRWSVDDVAERSGLGRTTVYRHFDGRDDLVAAALARDARRLFAAIADAVEHLCGLEDKLVEGFLVGLGAVRRTLLPRLIETDTTTALNLLTGDLVLALSRQALIERYRLLMPDGDQTDADLVAEALVRLAISFVVMPGSLIDMDDPDTARRQLRRLIVPLLQPGAGAVLPERPGG